MRKRKVYSYIKYPFSAAGWYGFFTGAAAFLMTAGILLSSVSADGAVPLFNAGIGLSAIILAATSLIFCLGGLFEKKKNHIFVYIGGGLSMAALLLWALVLL